MKTRIFCALISFAATLAIPVAFVSIPTFAWGGACECPEGCPCNHCSGKRKDCTCKKPSDIQSKSEGMDGIGGYNQRRIDPVDINLKSIILNVVYSHKLSDPKKTPSFYLDILPNNNLTPDNISFHIRVPFSEESDMLTFVKKVKDPYYDSKITLDPETATNDIDYRKPEDFTITPLNLDHPKEHKICH